MTASILEGVRVLDLSRVLAGPWAAQLLGDMGADVVKVERPGRGDDARSYQPFARTADGQATRESGFFLCANRNKRSITADLAQPEGQALVRALASQADVLIENYKVGDLARYGLGYGALAALNPRLVYCALTGYGQSGPYAERPGYDAVFQAQSGLMSVTGLPDGVPGGGPMKAGVSIVDILAGQNVASAVLGALYRRERHGEGGQFIEVALLDSAVAAMSHINANYFVTGQVPQRRGSEGNGGMPACTFATADGAFYLSVGNDTQYQRLCRVLDREDLARDERFQSNHSRWLHRVEMMEVFGAIFRHWTNAELLPVLAAHNVPAGAVNNVQQVFEDAQVRERGLRFSMAHPLLGQIDQVACPIRFARTPVRYDRPPPTLGQHADEVLAGWLGAGAAATHSTTDHAKGTP
ncbi:CaiB/BaiF CoA transferase family protein [Pseudorhodoferax sp.]|uniref:CaiB/BaiF CoA transferase family protein n=1 Tax=Pseudorhodoferax sp. TaxID=1993553 RepID=UPI002DD6B5DE|nr:CoA transferase [Pseudorhodoferax sp.]